MHKYHTDSVLVVGDLHIPYEHKDYLEFCKSIQKKVRCGTTVFIGDIVDNHSLSFHHDSNPNGSSPIDEIKEARKHLEPWFKAFPCPFLCLGNHDRRVDLKARHVGLPDEVFRPFREIWQLPKGWKDALEHELFGVRFIHGTGYSGDNAHMKVAQNSRQSCVIGHIHHICATGYTASEKDCIFGCATGCGINVKRYAFEYERFFPKKPLLGCAVVTDNGKNCQVFRMTI